MQSKAQLVKSFRISKPQEEIHDKGIKPTASSTQPVVSASKQTVAASSKQPVATSSKQPVAAKESSGSNYDDDFEEL